MQTLSFLMTKRVNITRVQEMHPFLCVQCTEKI